MIGAADRKEAIRLSLTRQLTVAGLIEFIPMAIDHAHHLYDTGSSAWASVQCGVKYGHQLEQRYLSKTPADELFRNNEGQI